MRPSMRIRDEKEIQILKGAYLHPFKKQRQYEDLESKLDFLKTTVLTKMSTRTHTNKDPLHIPLLSETA